MISSGTTFYPFFYETKKRTRTRNDGMREIEVDEIDLGSKRKTRRKNDKGGAGVRSG